MRKTFKAKSILIAVLTMVMALGLVLGLGLNNVKASADGETEPAPTTPEWQAYDMAHGTDVEVKELANSGIYISGNFTGATINNTDIMQVEGKTVTFQWRMNIGGKWMGFAFLDGKDGWNVVHHVGHHTAAAANTDKYAHLIINDDGAGQIHPAASATPIENMTNTPGSVREKLRTVEIHIGTGTNGDVSYMKVDGQMYGRQNNPSESALYWMTTDLFTNGCYLVLATAESPQGDMLLGKFNAPYTENVSSELSYVNLSEGDAPEDLTFTVKNIEGNAKLFVNGTEVTNETTYTVSDVEGGKKYVLKKSFWTVYQSVLRKSSAIYVQAENGKGAVATTVQLAAPPVWAGESYKEINEGDALSYTFTYTGAPQTADSIKVMSGVAQVSSTLVPETDYTLTKNETTYTLTFTPDYLAQAFGTYRSFVFSLTIGEDSLSGSVYCKAAKKGWYARSVDLAEDEIKTEGNYITAKLNKFNAGRLQSRIYYNDALDVTKPIILEFKNFDGNTEWGMLSVMDSLEMMDYFADGNANRTKLSALFFGKNRTNIQQMHGISGATGSIAEYEHFSGAKNIVLEMYFGATAEESYFRINGMDCGTVSVKQSDFRDGKAYVGFFFNNQVDSFEFKANKTVNGIAVTGPNKEASYKQDLADAKDLVLDVTGTTGANIEVTNAKGVKATAEEIAYVDGKLTIKAAYFAKLAFAKNDTLTIADKDTDTATEINMVYSTSNMAGTMVAFATKGDIKDAVFTLPEGITEVNDVLKNDVALTAANYSVKDGKLTLDKSQVSDTQTVNEFIVISGNKVIMAYVYVGEFENGYAKGGQGTVEAGKGSFIMTGASKVTLENVIDLKAGVIMKIDLKTIAAYYNNTVNRDNPTYIAFNFYDPNSGCTLIYKLYANFNAEEANATDTALYEEYKLVDADGQTVSSISGTRALSLEAAENKNALGVHLVKIEAAGEGLRISVDDQRATTIASLGNFTLGATILTTESSASIGENESKVAFRCYGINEEVNTEPITVEKDQQPDSGDSGDSGNDGGNCGSCNGVVSTSGAIGVLSLVVYAVIRKRKH